MHTEAIVSGADTVLIMVPFVVMMLLVMFRLDEQFTAPKSASNGPARGSGRAFCEVTQDGDSLLYDPDGTPAGTSAR